MIEGQISHTGESEQDRRQERKQQGRQHRALRGLRGGGAVDGAGRVDSRGIRAPHVLDAVVDVIHGPARRQQALETAAATTTERDVRSVGRGDRDDDEEGFKDGNESLALGA